VEIIKDWIENNKYPCVFITHSKNKGLCKTINEALTLCKGVYYQAIACDDILLEDKIDKQVAILEKYADVSLVCSNYQEIDEQGHILKNEYFSSDYNFPDEPTKAILSGHNGYGIIVHSPTVLLRLTVFEKVGKFDSLFFAYYEDVDLSWRIRLHGYSVILERKSVVYHMRSQTSKRFRPQIFEYHLYKNQLAMLIKNYGTKAFLKVTPVVGLLYFYRIINALKRNDGYLALATLKAVSWDIKNLQYLLLQRRYVQRFVRRVDDREIEKMMSKMPLQLLRKNL